METRTYLLSGIPTATMMVRWWRVWGSWKKTDEERIGCSVRRYNLQVEHALVGVWEKDAAQC
jgi:hypothetical protein